MLNILKRCRINFKIHRQRFVFLLTLMAVLTTNARPLHFPAMANGLPVDLALVLAVDVSYSVDETEFRLQMDGMALAFQHPAVHRAIMSGPYRRIAIAVTQWSGENRQIVSIPWQIVDSPQAALVFANRLAREPRRIEEGGTATGAAMRHAGALLLSAPFNTFRRVIDISSDGRNNRGIWPSNVRNQLAAHNITINGLAILNEWPTLKFYFENHIIGGPYHFVIVANDYQAYTDAIRQKLIKEISGPGIS